jgi:hypothetical protein
MGFELSGQGWRRERKREEKRRKRKMPRGKMDQEHTAGRNSQYWGNSAREVARPAVRKVD